MLGHASLSLQSEPTTGVSSTAAGYLAHLRAATSTQSPAGVAWAAAPQAKANIDDLLDTLSAILVISPWLGKHGYLHARPFVSLEVFPKKLWWECQDCFVGCGLRLFRG